MRQEGKRLRVEHLDVRFAVSPFSYPRVAVVVPRYRHTIVERNRLRRRLRELIRVELLRELPRVDLWVRATPSSYSLPFERLRADIARIPQQLSRAVAGASGNS